MRSIGNVISRPSIRRLGVQPVLSLTDAQYAHIRKGRFWSQSLCFSLQNLESMAISILLNLSTRPSDCCLYGVVWVRWSSNRSQSSDMSSDMNSAAWSECRYRGTPKRRNTSVTRVSATAVALWSTRGNASTHVVKQSQITNMHVFPSSVSSGKLRMSNTMRSIGAPFTSWWRPDRRAPERR